MPIVATLKLTNFGNLKLTNFGNLKTYQFWQFKSLSSLTLAQLWFAW